MQRRLQRDMVGPRWRSAASKDNDVKHEDHRYRIGLANGTKDIQLMIPYVTRRVFTRRLMRPLRPPATLNNQSTVMFHLRNPQMDRRIPPRTVNIFLFDKRRPGCASFSNPGWPDSAITPVSETRLPRASWGLFAGSLLLFSTLYLWSHPASIYRRRLATRSSSSSSCESSPHSSLQAPINKLSPRPT